MHDNISTNKIEINSEFKQAFDIVEKTNDSLFLTGRAGTGKSTFLKYFTENTKKKFVVLAPTGVAALNVGGETIHSFFRFHINMSDKDVTNKARSVAEGSIYHKLDLIIIDEISMVRADLLDHVDLFLRKVLKINLPFAGIQMLFIGDLYQLPPVVMEDEKTFFQEHYESPYFFDSNAVKNDLFKMKFIELQQVYRQSDEKFIEILNAVRNNAVHDSHLQELNSRYQPAFNDSEFITLTTTNNIANTLNSNELAKIKLPDIKYTAKISGDIGKSTYPTEEKLILKPGCKVMFLNNDKNNRWVNGTIGTVSKVDKDHVIVQTRDGISHKVESHDWQVIHYNYDVEKQSLNKDVVGSFTQLPLRLAWAITIHKSQGKTFDNMILDIGWGTFAHGQTYVALSRSRSLDGIVLRKPLKKSHITLDLRITKFLSEIDSTIEKREAIFEEKINYLKSLQNNESQIEVSYINSDGKQSKTQMIITNVGEQKSEGKSFVGIRAFCKGNPEESVFRIDRILDIKILDQPEFKWN